MKEREKQLWILLGNVISSTHKIKIMRLLEKNPLTPTQLHSKTQLSLSHISRLLKQLVEKELVVCLNPNQRKGKMYTLTARGLWISRKIE